MPDMEAVVAFLRDSRATAFTWCLLTCRYFLHCVDPSHFVMFARTSFELSRLPLVVNGPRTDVCLAVRGGL